MALQTRPVHGSTSPDVSRLRPRDPQSGVCAHDSGRRESLALATLSYLFLFGVWVALDRGKEKEVEVLLKPEVKDFAVEETPEPEPRRSRRRRRPSSRPSPTVQKPKPKPRPVEVPRGIPKEAPPEQGQARRGQEDFGTGQPGSGTGTGKPKPEVKKPEVKKPEPPKPAKPAAEPGIDPTKPVDRPEKATVPQADAGNKPPGYPSELVKQASRARSSSSCTCTATAPLQGREILPAPATPPPASTNRPPPTKPSRHHNRRDQGLEVQPVEAERRAHHGLDHRQLPFRFTAG